MSGHIMLSYQRNSTDLVSKIYDYLINHQSIPIWMDQHGGVQEYLSESLAEGVENCCVIVCFLTPEYQKSEYCKKELTYASELHKSIIPIIVGSNDKTIKWKPSHWLGFTIADLLYLNFTNINQMNFEQKVEELIEKINSILQNTKSDQIKKQHSIEKQRDEEEDFQIHSSFIIPPTIHHGPQIKDENKLIIPKKYSSEGDSCIHLLYQSTEIQTNQDLYSKNGFFFNSFILPHFIFHNTSNQSISILQLLSEYEDQNSQWVPCEIKTNLSENIITIEPNKYVSCLITIKIKLEGEPGYDSEHRSRAHRLLPQPFRIKISVEDTLMKHRSLIIEQVNQPLNLPTKDKLIKKLNLFESNLLDFVWSDDCLNDVRYFLLIIYSNDENPLIKFIFGCGLCSFRCPTWNKKDLQILQRTAREQNRSELIVHEGIMDSFFHCKALFDEKFKLRAVQIQIQTKTSSIEQTIALPIQNIFTETSIF